jgi:hypothetical protein
LRVEEFHLIVSILFVLLSITVFVSSLQ